MKTNDVTTMDVTSIQKFVEDSQILKAKVDSISVIEGKQCLCVSIISNGPANKLTGVILREEADLNFKSGYLNDLIDSTISVLITAVDAETGVLEISRKKAQAKIKDEHIERLTTSGDDFDGVIVSFCQSGAFVAVDEVLGLLKTSDYSTDYSEISETYKVGDTIKVCCLSVKSEGKISWEVPEKVKRANPIEHNLQKGSVVTGTVQGIRDVQTATLAFIRVGVGLDVMCRMPDDLELRYNNKVAVQITNVEPPEEGKTAPRVRGNITKVLSY